MSDRLQSVAAGGSAPKKGFAAWIAGRSRRREYWAWVGPALIIGNLLEFSGIPGARFIVAPPMLIAMIRRLHDLGRSGWLAPLINVATNSLNFAAVSFLGPQVGVIVGFLIYIGAIVALGAIPGQPKRNLFGLPPGQKAPEGLAETFS